MARASNNQKIHRVVGFLLALRDPRARQPLATYGFTQEELSRGHRLLRAATEGQLSQRGEEKISPALLARLDEIDNRWFPILKYALVHHDPAIAEWLFLNLAQGHGRQLVVSLSTLFERVQQLADGSSPFGEAGKVAFAALQKRGLSDQVLAEITALLTSIEQFDEATGAVDPVAVEQAVVALWAWYLEWGGIARTVIKDRRVLRKLGFLRSRTSTEVDEDDTEEITTAPGAVANAGSTVSSTAPSTTVLVPSPTLPIAAAPVSNGAATNAAATNGASNGAAAMNGASAMSGVALSSS